MSTYTEAVMRAEVDAQSANDLEQGIVRRHETLPPLSTAVWVELCKLDARDESYASEIMVDRGMLASAMRIAERNRVMGNTPAKRAAQRDAELFRDRERAKAMTGAPVSHFVMAGEGRGVP